MQIVIDCDVYLFSVFLDEMTIFVKIFQTPFFFFAAPRMSITEHSSTINASQSSANKLSHSLLDSSTHSIDYNSITRRINKQFNFKSMLWPLNHNKELKLPLFIHTKDSLIHESWYKYLNNPFYHFFIISLSISYWIGRIIVLYDFYSTNSMTFFYISLIWSLLSQIPMSAIACKYITEKFELEYYFKSLGTLIFLIFTSIIFVETGPLIPICMYFLRRCNQDFNALDTAHI